MTEQIRSVWYEVQAEQGAEFEDFDGWAWTATLGDVPREYEAIRTDVGMWDLYPLVKWDFSGADALRAAQRVFSNDLRSLVVGQVRYGAFVNEDGLMMDDGTVYKLAEDHCWVMTNNFGYEDWFSSAFEGLDVRFEDRTHSMPLLSVQGPRSREVLQGLTDADLSRLGYFRFWPETVRIGGIQAWVLRTGFSGELGFELIADPGDAVDLWRAVQGAGATVVGTHAIEIARIESGMIIIEVDYEQGARTPYDLSFDRLVKLDAGFAGADSLRSVAADPPNRLVTLRIEGDEVPEYGAAVTVDGEEVGVLTSPTASPRLGTIGLAIVRTEYASVGNAVQVALGDGAVPAVVDIPSLYDPEKRRPRS
jgi:aminomethyltransferase